MPGHPGPAFGRPECKLVPGIHVFLPASIVFKQDVDGRDKPGHDVGGARFIPSIAVLSER
jgi:hypothetical protein